ncbi:hypothetical protein BIZ42_02195 [Stenotrophomonas sp. LM091]|uniref:hypothetical protein n=1 Tax=Stenotrophomonas sp. LM091 TaxID=1904944 RepID=UPI0002E0D680|nr:hypothetical protein [Stenotrophomonas sp. LM091]AOX61102.1 hypothetical protein BIZ42_02195 [Stenotrophomonas sp. LM091]
MSILNVLLRPDQLLVAVDTWAEDALTHKSSVGAKLLLIPQHNLVLASRGSAQFFLKIYELCLQASFRADFTMEQLMAELGPAMDHLWPNYLQAAAEAGLTRHILHSELVLGGWSPKNGRMVATAYAKDAGGGAARVQPLDGGVASPGEPLRGRKDSFELEAVLEAGRLQATYLNSSVGRTVAGGRLLVAVLQKGQTSITDVAAL